MASLNSSPNEVLVIIFEQISHSPTLKSLALVSKRLHAVVLPFLFHTITLGRQDQEHPAVDQVNQIRHSRITNYISHLILRGSTSPPSNLEELDWKPIASLVKQIPILTDLTY